MIKEQVNLKNILMDLRRILKGGYICSVLFAFFFLLFLVVFLSDVSIPLFYKFLCILFIGLLLLCFVLTIVDIIKLHILIRNKKCIVKDRLIRTEEHTTYVGKRMVIEYRLIFSCYGEYTIPDDNYKWSRLYSMSNRGIYDCSDSGDEFYLVLSKPHTGNILLAYNTKQFDMDDSFLYRKPKLPEEQTDIKN